MTDNYEVEYASSYHPPRFLVGGWFLVPLTFGHAVILTALENPLMPWIGKRTVGIPALAQMAFACSRSPARAERWIGARSRLVAHWVLHYAMARIQRGSFAVELASAIRYVRFWMTENADCGLVDGSNKTRSEASVLASIASRACGAGMSREELLQTPFRLLNWESVCASERDGAVRVRSRNRELIEMAEREIRHRRRNNGRGH